MGMFDRADATAYTTPEPAKATGARGVRTLSSREADDVWRAQMLSELRLMRETSTDAAARGSSGILNSVLEVSTYLFDATDSVVKSYQVAVGSIVVVNNAATPVTVQSGTGSGDTAPTQGRGVIVVAAQSKLAIPIGAHAFTLWGTAGAAVGVQVFAGMQAFGVAR